MLHVVSIWLLVAALAAAGVINAIGLPSGKSGFVRWGYPDWWCYLTGGLEMVAAVLIALPSGREAGLFLASMVIAAAILTVLFRRELSHVVPLGIFVVLIGLVQFSA